MTSPRIMPGLVVSAYGLTGLTPTRSSWFSDQHATALVAVALMTKRIDRRWLLVEDVEKQEDAVIRGLANAGFSYLVGFSAGFNGERSARFHLGVQDGEAAWQAVEHAGLVK